MISKAIFEKQEGRSLTEKDAVERIAKDYGIDPSRMTVVEQPGQFHIDMAISPVTNGKLLVNDARAAFALQERLIKEDYEKAKPTDPAKVQAWEEKGKQITKALDELKEKTERRALLEDKAVSQLEAAGLSVVRVPGVMDRVDPARSISAAAAAGNFLNSEKGTNAKGEQFVVFLGGDPRVEQRVAETVGKSFPEVERIYFLDRSASEKSVGMKGGVSCRVNVIPE